MSTIENYKTPMRINARTRMNNDACERESRIRGNQTISERNFVETFAQNTDYGRANYINSTADLGVYQDKNKDRGGHFVDEESFIRNGDAGNKITSEKKKVSKLLQHRPYITVPYMGAGQTSIVQPDTWSKMAGGEPTRTGKGCDSLAGVSINRFTPLVPCLAAEVQNVKHIVPTCWVRGGMDTRGEIRNINYYRECGIRKPLS